MDSLTGLTFYDVVWDLKDGHGPTSVTTGDCERANQVYAALRATYPNAVVNIVPREDAA